MDQYIIPQDYENPIEEYELFKLISSNNDYCRNISLIINCHKEIWENPIHKHYTKHGKKHTENMLIRLNEWLKGVDFKRLENNSKRSAQASLFILLASIYLHDIGMQCKSPILLEKCNNKRLFSGIGSKKFKKEEISSISDLEHKEIIRENHALLGYEMIMDSLNLKSEYDLGNFNLRSQNINGEMMAVALIVAAHNDPIPKDIETKIDENYQISGGPRINLKRLSYILRITDALDADCSRIDYNLFSKENMWEQFKIFPPKFLAHIIKHHAVDSVSLPDFKFIVSLEANDLKNLNENAKHSLAYFILRPLKENIKKYGNSLNKMRIPIPSDIQIKSDEWKITKKRKIGINPVINDFLYYHFSRSQTPQLDEALKAAEEELWVIGQNLYFITNPSRRTQGAIPEDYFINLFLNKIKDFPNFKIRVLIFNPLAQEIVVEWHNKLIVNWSATPEHEKSPEHKEKPDFISDLRFSFDKLKKLQIKIENIYSSITNYEDYPLLIKCISERIDSANIVDPNKYGTISITHTYEAGEPDTMSTLRDRKEIKYSNDQAYLWNAKMKKYKKLIETGTPIQNINNIDWQGLYEKVNTK